MRTHEITIKKNIFTPTVSQDNLYRNKYEMLKPSDSKTS